MCPSRCPRGAAPGRHGGAEERLAAGGQGDAVKDRFKYRHLAGGHPRRFKHKASLLNNVSSFFLPPPGPRSLTIPMGRIMRRILLGSLNPRETQALLLHS